MAEPARKTSHVESGEPDEESSGAVMLQRWVERPDGNFELQETPLTLEDYLDPQLEDKLTQGRPHSEICHFFFERLRRYFPPDGDVIVLQDVKILLRPGRAPSPDVSVIRGARDNDPDLSSFDVVEQGVVPCLVIEVVSPFDARVRRMDEIDKLDLYERVRIPEYLLVDPPRRATGHRFRIRGHRLGPDRRYRPIEPDAQGRILSETTNLRFGVSPDGKQLEIFVAGTGERLLSPSEIERAYEAAQERAAREASAREAAEEELKRLRAEIERLRKA